MITSGSHLSAYTFISEPVNPLYDQLLNLSLTQCKTMLLVVRPELGLSIKAKGLLQDLSLFLLKKESASSWPGTTLFEKVAELYYFRLESASLQLLKKACSGLYSWLQPALPEDLCFLRQNGEAWLITISHEHDSYLSITSNEYQRILSLEPNLGFLLRRTE